MARGFRTKIAASQLVVEQRTVSGTGGLNVTPNDALKIDFSVVTDKSLHSSLEAVVSNNSLASQNAISSIDVAVSIDRSSYSAKYSSLDTRISAENSIALVSRLSLESSISSDSSVKAASVSSVDVSISSEISARASVQSSLDVRIISDNLLNSTQHASIETRLSIIESSQSIEISVDRISLSDLATLHASEIASLSVRIVSTDSVESSNQISIDTRLDNFEVETIASITSIEVMTTADRAAFDSYALSADSIISNNNTNRISAENSLDARITDNFIISSHGIVWAGEFSTLADLITFLSGQSEALASIGTTYFCSTTKSGYTISDGSYPIASAYVTGWVSKYLTKISDHDSESSIFNSIDQRSINVDISLSSLDTNISTVSNSLSQVISANALSANNDIVSLDSLLNGLVYGGQSNATSLAMRLFSEENTRAAKVSSLSTLIDQNTASLTSRISLTENNLAAMDPIGINSSILSLDISAASDRLSLSTSISSLDSRISVDTSLQVIRTSSIDSAISQNNSFELSVQASTDTAIFDANSLISSIEASVSSRISLVESLESSNNIDQIPRILIATFKIGTLGPDTVPAFAVFDPDLAGGISLMKTSNFSFKTDILKSLNPDTRNGLSVILNGVHLYPELSSGSIKIYNIIPTTIDGDYCLIDNGTEFGIIFPFDIMFLDKIQIRYK